MFTKKFINILVFICILPFLFNSCANRGDARKSPPDPKERVKRNLEQGKGFRLMDSVKKGGSTNFEFASSNELWRASLDVIDFMPLSSVNYSGGIIISDWYSSDENSNESVKISIRFLTNEIRSDALDIKVFRKICKINNKCKTTQGSNEIITELKKKILKTAKIYEDQKKDKNYKPYKPVKIPGN
ncbi:DUF3576 domain-containing protein [Candidatus Pelagibacter bacterium]|nr:DUF3576 domain-containing protein [Candidatus Pelagibacter bacterium]